MELIKISVLGISGVLFGMLLKQMKPEYTGFLTLGIGICILLLSVGKVGYLFAAMAKIRTYLPVGDTYLTALLKMLGIAYIGQFSAGICKDSGYSAIGGQIELFSRLAIMAVSMPVLLALLETLNDFLS